MYTSAFPHAIGGTSPHPSRKALRGFFIAQCNRSTTQTGGHRFKPPVCAFYVYKRFPPCNRSASRPSRKRLRGLFFRDTNHVFRFIASTKKPPAGGLWCNSQTVIPFFFFLWDTCSEALFYFLNGFLGCSWRIFTNGIAKAAPEFLKIQLAQPRKLLVFGVLFGWCVCKQFIHSTIHLTSPPAFSRRLHNCAGNTYGSPDSIRVALSPPCLRLAMIRRPGFCGTGFRRVRGRRPPWPAVPRGCPARR